MATPSIASLLYQRILTATKSLTATATPPSTPPRTGNAKTVAKLKLEGLPLDVRVLIVSFLHLYDDVKSLMLSCRSLYEASVPKYYHSIAFIGIVDVDRTIAMLNPDNEGLKHIRHLAVEPGLDSDPDQLLHVLAHLLPRDILITFSLDYFPPLESKNALRVLHRRQRCLRNARLEGSVLQAEAVLNGAALQNITLLHIQIDCRITNPGHELLGSLPALMHLEIRAGLDQYCAVTNRDSEVPSERAGASEEIIEAVFGRKFVDGHKLETVTLRSLSLYELDLAKSSRLLEAVDCSRLHSLVLQRCDNIPKLLAHIRPTGFPSRMSLTNLVLSAREEWRADRAKDDETINDFLKSFCGLEQLLIHGPNDETIRPSCDAIAVHHDTLCLLFLSCKWSDEGHESHYDPDALQACLGQCLQLEQLAIQTPPILLEREAESVRQHHGAFAASISAAPSLRTLRILSSPDQDQLDYSVHDIQPSHVWMDAKLRMYATEYLAHLLSVNAISIGSEEYDFSGFTYSASYSTRGKLTDAYGRANTVAIAMKSKEQAQDIEPVSDIFDIEPSDSKIMRYGYEDLV
ncbi:hypothetical protein LTR56_006893 [Elasticomyces elasticus]|nr:hypothetical protein LTR22_016578 [Elasticomyces elasticus]KAK3649417.1 hypothetical protein LTR56_006893 [Elasticomyces elasticus]KAK4928050.1 hypothetical protein LTR49_005249 [Elasticomyces elasticus]KAK5753367.1 hypothetical protein LTS12_016514 [Elasticomyces elasticus]